MNIPTSLNLTYSKHARREWSDRLGFIKNPPTKFLRFYTKFVTQSDGTIKATYPFVHDKRYQLVLIINPENGIVLTNYLSQKNRNKLLDKQP